MADEEIPAQNATYAHADFLDRIGRTAHVHLAVHLAEERRSSSLHLSYQDEGPRLTLIMECRAAFVAGTAKRAMAAIRRTTET
ncbi:hypothetical protein ACGFNU_44860 [Spirillospora sp. NPDC048911]|uniref:hypothetical protein n=1 Tax=Spirillospora sp. NPDC048911 TaxID=3364527 RepID=UPI00371E54C1